VRTALEILQYTVSQKKLCHSTFVHNVDKCWPIFKILSLLYSPRNMQQNPYHTARHTLDVRMYRGTVFRLTVYIMYEIQNETLL